MILERCKNVPFSGSSKIISNPSNNGNLLYLIILLLGQCHLSSGYYHFGNDVFPRFPPIQPSPLTYPTISHFPISQSSSSPYFNNHQFGLTNYFSNHQPPSPFTQSANPTFPNFWSPHQSSPLANSDSETKLTSDSNSGSGGGEGSESSGGSGGGEEVVAGGDNVNGNSNSEAETIASSTHDKHEKQAEKNTENMWPQSTNPTSNRRFGLLTKLWRKKKAKKQSNKHKHDHFHHQSVHHHHHHHHYHHHIHHYPGKKPNPFKSAMKKFKYKWKFKSKVKEIGEASPTQHIYDQPTPVYQPPLPHHRPPSPYTVHHHYTGQQPNADSGYW